MTAAAPASLEVSPAAAAAVAIGGVRGSWLLRAGLLGVLGVVALSFLLIGLDGKTTSKGVWLGLAGGLVVLMVLLARRFRAKLVAPPDQDPSAVNRRMTTAFCVIGGVWLALAAITATTTVRAQVVTFGVVSPGESCGTLLSPTTPSDVNVAAVCRHNRDARRTRVFIQTGVAIVFLVTGVRRWRTGPGRVQPVVAT